MLQRKYKRRGFRVLEMLYLQDIDSSIKSHGRSHIDVIKVYQANNDLNNQLQKSCTLHIDLTQTEEAIFKSFRPTTRNEIRRNINRDKVEYTCETTLDEARINLFASNLNRFSQKKKFHEGCRTDTDYLISQIKDFKQNAILTVVSKNNTILSEHLYFYDNNRARYMFGISYRLNKNIDIAPNVVGRSNRGLHWYDIQEFKKRGIEIYDLGGISCNTTDSGLLNVKRFKEGFSQNRVIEYDGNIPVSLRGKLALFTNSFLQKVTELRH